MSRLTASRLREDIYHVLDHVRKTGEPIEISRKGAILRIVPSHPIPKLSRLKKRNILRVPAEKIIHLDWIKEWKP